MEFSAQQIASVLGGTVEGDPEVKVNNFSKIEEGKPGTLTFLANPKYEHFIYQTEASIVLVNNDFTPAEPVKATLVKVANAYASLAILLNMAEEANVKKAGIACFRQRCFCILSFIRFWRIWWPVIRSCWTTAR